MSTPLEQARQAARERIAQRERIQGALPIAKELQAVEAARPRASFYQEYVEPTVQVARGAMLAVAEIPQAFADLGTPAKPGELDLNEPLRWFSRELKGSINLYMGGDSETTAGQFAESVGRFVGAFLPLSRAVKAGTLLGRGSTAVVAGAITDFAAFEPHEANLSALVESYPELSNPVTEFLATDPNDEPAVNRLRNAVEGMGLGAVTDGFLLSLKALRGVHHARARLDTEKAARAAANEIEVPTPAPAKVSEAAADADPKLPIIEAPTPTKLPDIELEAGGRFKFPINNDAGEPFGIIMGSSDGASFNVSTAALDEASRGKGFASRAYGTLADLAHARGGVLRSENQVTTDAARVYASLGRRGYAVAKNPTAALKDGTWIAADGNPVFEVGPKKAATNPAADVAGATQLPTAQLSVALRATGQTDLTDFNARLIDWESFGNKADDIFNILEKISRSYSKQITDATGGVIPVAETAVKADQVITEAAKIAQLTGGTVESVVSSLFRDVRGGQGIAARTHAAQELLLASAGRINALAREVRGSGDGVGRAKLLIAIEQHAAIQAQLKGAVSEVARALRQMQELKGAADIDLDMLSRIDANLVKKLAGEQRLTDLNKAVRRVSGNRFSDYALEVWINGLLSNPVTHVVNFTSNVLKAAMAIPERAIAAGIGKVRQLAGQNVERVRLQETLSVSHGLFQGAIDAFKMPLATLRKSGAAIARWDLDAAKKIITDDEESFGNVYRSLARGHGVVDATTKLEVRGQAFHWDTSQTQSALSRGLRHFGNITGSAIRAPGAALQASDELFKSMAYRQQLHALAMRTALGEADQLPRGAREAFMRKRVGEILKKPPEEMQMASITFAQQQTFTNKLGPFGQWIQQGTARFPILRLLVPFIRTPSNILKDFVSYTPAPLVKLFFQEGRRQLMAGGPQADIMLARMFMGTAAMAGVWQLADAGLLRGGGPQGKDSSELGGQGTYSIKFGNTWYSFNRLEPLGMLFGATADLHDIMERQYDIDGDNTNLLEAVQLAALAAAKNAASKTWLTGIADAVEAASDWERYGENYLDRLATSFVPFSSGMRWAAGIEDPFARETFDFIDKVRAMVPGDGASLAVRRDYLGRPVKHNRPWLSPIAISEESTDPVDRELSRLAFEFQMPNKSIEGVPLSAHQYSRLLELRGTLGGDSGNLHATLTERINDPAYAQLSDSPDPSIDRGSKAAEVKRVVGAFSRVAQKALLAEDDALRQAWMEAKLRSLAQ